MVGTKSMGLCVYVNLMKILYMLLRRVHSIKTKDHKEEEKYKDETKIIVHQRYVEINNESNFPCKQANCGEILLFFR